MKTKSLWLAFWIALGTYPDTDPRADEPKIAIIVNAKNPAQTLSAEQIADFFLKRKRQWPDGTPVHFIDRSDRSPVRSEFLQNILGKTGREVELHWIGRKLSSGDSAPIQAGSDAMTVSLVGHLKGAIGYVSPAYVNGTAKGNNQKKIKRILLEERGK